jgi:hypothetical protein
VPGFAWDSGFPPGFGWPPNFGRYAGLYRVPVPLSAPLLSVCMSAVPADPPGACLFVLLSVIVPTWRRKVNERASQIFECAIRHSRHPRVIRRWRKQAKHVTI